jgi:uncharacterized Zn finger protein
MEKLKCIRCSNEKPDKIRLTLAGPHVKASCKQCGSFIKFVTKTKVDLTTVAKKSTFF